MAQIGAPPGHDPVPIGEVSAPPFARLPDPATLFRARAERLRDLAEGHDLSPYLRFLAGLAEVQDVVATDLPEPVLPPADALARSREFGMPALDRPTLLEGTVSEATIVHFLDGAAALDMPAPARAALEAVRTQDAAGRAYLAGNVLDSAVPFEQVAEHVFLAAGLQVHAARCASRLDAGALAPVGQGLCPACGSPPVASLIVGWRHASGARFCACSLCGTLWNHVRVRCISCGGGKGIAYQELEGSDGAVKAECCRECRTYLKIMNQTKNPALDPVADDAATSALDILVAEDGLRRAGANPFLLGY